MISEFPVVNIRRLAVLLGITFLVWQLIITPVTGKKNNQEGQIKGAKIAKIELPGLQLPPKVKAGTKDPPIAAKQFTLYEPESGYLISGRGEHTPVPVASLTKMMTAIIVVEQFDLTKEVEISKNAVSVIGSDTQLRFGEKLAVESLLKSVLISSANDAAYALAESYEGGLENFVRTMNEKAHSLGMRQTEFKDPAGLDDSGRSTPKDLAILASYFLKHPKLVEIVKIPETTISSTDSKMQHRLESSNRLVKEELHYPGILGIKTGFTPEAGHSIAVAAERDNHTLVAVVLNTHLNTKDASAREAAKLLDWGFTNLEWGT